jgi:hypothetical protein
MIRSDRQQHSHLAGVWIRRTSQNQKAKQEPLACVLQIFLQFLLSGERTWRKWTVNPRNGLR